MQNIHQCAAVLQQGLQKIVVVGVPMRVLDIVVDPNAVEKPQGLLSSCFPGGIIFVERIVEVILQNGIHPDGICAQLLNIPEPSEICLFIDSVVRGPLPRNTHAQIDTADLKGDV